MELAIPAAAGGQYKPAPRLTLKRTTDLDQAHAHILLFGATKVGKTTTAVSIVKPSEVAIVTTQPEEQLAHLRKLDIPYVRARNADQLDQVLDNPRGVFGPDFKALVVDDMTEAADFYVRKFEGSSKDARQVYKAMQQHLRGKLESLLEGDYHLVCTALERTLSDEFNVSWIQPDMPPSAANLVTAKFSFIFYVTADHKLVTRRDPGRRILAGNRLPKDKVDTFKLDEEADLARLWERFSAAIR